MRTGLDPEVMDVGGSVFGPVRLAWTDAAASDLDPDEVLRPFGRVQERRHSSMTGIHARRFLAGRWLLAGLISELTTVAPWGFTTTCERCGAEHGRPRLETGAVHVSVSYAGSVVAVAASDAAAVGVDIEEVPVGGSSDRPLELGRLFAPASVPDIRGWTLLEAALKADGRGLVVDVAHVEVGAPGSGEVPGSRAVRIPDRTESIDAGLVSGPRGFVLSAATAQAAGESRCANS